jgi:uncharacterized protein (DUF2062 family)
VYFRLNLPVLMAAVFVSNPFTWVPQVAGSLWVGAKLLGLDLMPFLIAAASGYVLAQAAWRARVIYQLRRRRARSSGRSVALD